MSHTGIVLREAARTGHRTGVSAGAVADPRRTPRTGYWSTEGGAFRRIWHLVTSWPWAQHVRRFVFAWSVRLEDPPPSLDWRGPDGARHRRQRQARADTKAGAGPKPVREAPSRKPRRRLDLGGVWTGPRLRAAFKRRRLFPVTQQGPTAL